MTNQPGRPWEFCREVELSTAMEAMATSPRDGKVPKFKRCKISRPQLLVLMQYFGAPARSAWLSGHTRLRV